MTPGIRERKPRGLGKKPARVHVTIRVSRETAEFFSRTGKPTVAMREVLEAYMKENANKGLTM